MTEDKRTIHIRGTGHAAQTPDTVVLSLTLTAQNKEYSAAMKIGSQQVEMLRESIVEAGFDGTGRYAVRFLGRADCAQFRVISSDDLSVPEEEWNEVRGTVAPAGTGTNVWTQAAPPADGEDARFYRVRAALPED